MYIYIYTLYTIKLSILLHSVIISQSFRKHLQHTFNTHKRSMIIE